MLPSSKALFHFDRFNSSHVTEPHSCHCFNIKGWKGVTFMYLCSRESFRQSTEEGQTASDCRWFHNKLFTKDKSLLFVEPSTFWAICFTLKKHNNPETQLNASLLTSVTALSADLETNVDKVFRAPWEKGFNYSWLWELLKRQLSLWWTYTGNICVH